MAGEEGRGWSRFSLELSKVKAVIDSTVGSSAATPFDDPSSRKKEGSQLGQDAACPGGVRSFLVGDAPSYAEVVHSSVSYSKKNGPLV